MTLLFLVFGDWSHHGSWSGRLVLAGLFIGSGFFVESSWQLASLPVLPDDLSCGSGLFLEFGRWGDLDVLSYVC